MDETIPDSWYTFRLNRHGQVLIELIEKSHLLIMTGDKTPRPRNELPPKYIEVGSGDLIEVTSFVKVIFDGGPRRIPVPMEQLYQAGAPLANLPLHIGPKQSEPASATSSAHQADVVMNFRLVGRDASEDEKKRRALIFRFHKKPPAELHFEVPVTPEEVEERGTGTLTIFHIMLKEPFVVDGEEVWEIIFVVPPEKKPS